MFSVSTLILIEILSQAVSKFTKTRIGRCTMIAVL